MRFSISFCCSLFFNYSCRFFCRNSGLRHLSGKLLGLSSYLFDSSLCSLSVSSRRTSFSGLNPSRVDSNTFDTLLERLRFGMLLTSLKLCLDDVISMPSLRCTLGSVKSILPFLNGTRVITIFDLRFCLTELLKTHYDCPSELLLLPSTSSISIMIFLGGGVSTVFLFIAAVDFSWRACLILCRIQIAY